jgi:hypothetical protein
MKITILRHTPSGLCLKGEHYWTLDLVKFDDPRVRVWVGEGEDNKSAICRWVKTMIKRVKDNHKDVNKNPARYQDDYVGELVKHIPNKDLTDYDYFELVGRQFEIQTFDLSAAIPSATITGTNILPKQWKKLTL